MIICREIPFDMPRIVVLISAALLISPFAAAQTPVPSALPATTAESPEVREFQKIDDNWSNAVNQRDQYGLELVLSPLFVDVSAVGDVTTRNQQVATLITTDDKTMHLDQRVITARLLGDVAVANGTYVLHHRRGSAQVDDKGVFTQVFQRVHGGWLCINSQRTLLREETSQKAKKQTSAELPFHIPLFSKN
jgi:hypothetical protein